MPRGNHLHDNLLATCLAACFLLSGCDNHGAEKKIASESVARGKTVFKNHCIMCHSVGGGNFVAPNLRWIYGATAGKMRYPAYSKVLREANFVWDRGTLDAFLTQPRLMLPGNQMAFFGMPNEVERAALIDYLEWIAP